MSDEEQTELQDAELVFYPKLGIKTRESRDVHLHTSSGKIYRGIRVWRGQIKMPSFLELQNRSEIRERQLSLSEITRKELTRKIKDELFKAAAGLL